MRKYEDLDSNMYKLRNWAIHIVPGFAISENDVWLELRSGGMESTCISIEMIFTLIYLRARESEIYSTRFTGVNELPSPTFPFLNNCEAFYFVEKQFQNFGCISK